MPFISLIGLACQNFSFILETPKVSIGYEIRLKVFYENAEERSEGRMRRKLGGLESEINERKN